MNGQLCGGLCFAMLDKTFEEYAEKIDVSEENCLTGFDLVDKLNFISSKLNESGVGEVVTTSERNIACGNFKSLGNHGWQWVDDWSECAMIIWTDYDANPFHQMYSDKGELVREIEGKLLTAGLPIPENIGDFIGEITWCELS